MTRKRRPSKICKICISRTVFRDDGTWKCRHNCQPELGRPGRRVEASKRKVKPIVEKLLSPEEVNEGFLRAGAKELDGGPWAKWTHRHGSCATKHGWKGRR